MQKSRVREPASYGEDEANQGGAFKAYALFLSSSQLGSFPHLEAYRDHFVLGNHDIQVIFAGIPHRVPKEAWQPSVVAVFRKHDEDWLRNKAVEGIALQRSNEKGRYFYPIAMDMGQESGGFAFLTVIYTDKEGVGAKTAVTWRLKPLQPILSLVTTPLQENRKNTRGQLWRLRVQTKQAKVHAKGLYAHWYKQTAVANVFDHLAFAARENSFGIVSYQGFDLLEKQAFWELDPYVGGLLGLSGFSFLFGERWVSRLRDYLHILHLCQSDNYHNKEKLQNYSSEERFFLLQKCQKLARKSQIVNPVPLSFPLRLLPF